MEKIVKKSVQGNWVEYDSSISALSYGINYLQYDLDSKEASVFFLAAKRTGEARFEDDYENQFTLTYDRYKYVYKLTKRDY